MCYIALILMVTLYLFDFKGILWLHCSHKIRLEFEGQGTSSYTSSAPSFSTTTGNRCSLVTFKYMAQALAT